MIYLAKINYFIEVNSNDEWAEDNATKIVEADDEQQAYEKVKEWCKTEYYMIDEKIHIEKPII